MSYYLSKTVAINFEDAEDKIKQELEKEGFGIIFENYVSQTLNEKLNAGLRKYKILGACNAPFALRALQAENKIGTMLPCNVILQELENGQVEIAAIDPVSTMEPIKNNALLEIASEVKEKIATALDRVS